jgi:hypothetical protein
VGEPEGDAEANDDAELPSESKSALTDWCSQRTSASLG